MVKLGLMLITVLQVKKGSEVFKWPNPDRIVCAGKVINSSILSLLE